jgi:hypothetical protein
LSSFPTNVTFQRIGAANHYRSADWATNRPALNEVNPGLGLPWTYSGIRAAASPATALVSHGVWTGTVALPNSPAGTAAFLVDDGMGVSSMSAPFQVLPLAPLRLVVPISLQPATESQAGVAGWITVSVPSPATTNVPVSLVLSEAGEFDVPPEVVIAAGSNAVTFPVTNRDDVVADGLASVRLTALAAGYTSATGVLQNADDEVGQLLVIVPTPLKEDSGFTPEPIRVFLNQVAPHDTLIPLSADAPLEVPDSVVVPAGRLSQSFQVRVGDDSLVNPPGRTVRIRASMPRWPVAEGVVSLTDDEDAGFSLSAPSVIVEGTPTAGQIQVRVAHAADTPFTLTSNQLRLQVPAQVTLPAGALSEDFSITVPDNSEPDDQVTAQLCAQTSGQTSQCKSLTVTDDEVNIARLVMTNVPAAVLTGSPLPFSASLVNGAGHPQWTNVPGELALDVSPALARLVAPTNPIAFSNGTWSNFVSFEGEALDVALRVSAAGFQTNSARFDLLGGRVVALTFNDAVWHAGLGKFLVAEPAQTNVAAGLGEVGSAAVQRGPRCRGKAVRAFAGTVHLHLQPRLLGKPVLRRSILGQVSRCVGSEPVQFLGRRLRL